MPEDRRRGAIAAGVPIGENDCYNSFGDVLHDGPDQQAEIDTAQATIAGHRHSDLRQSYYSCGLVQLSDLLPKALEALRAIGLVEAQSIVAETVLPK